MTPPGSMIVDRAVRCSFTTASVQFSTGVTHASVPAKIRRPLGAGPARKAVGEDRAHLVVSVEVELVGHLIGGQPEPAEKQREELRLDRPDRHVLAVGGLVGPVVRRAAIEHERLALVLERPVALHPPHHLSEDADTVHHRGVDHLALAGSLPLVQRGDDAEQHEHRATAEVGHQVQRRDGRPVAVADGMQRPGLRQVVDVVARGLRERAVLTPPGDAREDQPRVDRRALVRPDAEPLARAGAEAVEQHVGLRDEVQQQLRVVLDVEVDGALPAVHQVDVLGRHLKGSLPPVAPLAQVGPPHPHDVGAQVGQDHPRMRTGSDSAEFDHPHPGKGPRHRHEGTVTQRFSASPPLTGWR